MSGILGYSLKGIEVEIGKGATQKVFNPIISARITQGEFEYIEVSEEEKRDIIERWHAQTAAKEKGKQRRMSV